MNNSTFWFAFSASLVAFGLVWFKLQALALLAPAANFTQRVFYSLAIANICFLVAKISATTIGMAWTAPIVLVTENLLVLAYTWHFLPSLRTRTFWKEFATVRIPRWYRSAKQLPAEFASVWFWMDQWRHMRQLMQPWRQDLGAKQAKTTD